jgi:hypothetical protein
MGVLTPLTSLVTLLLGVSIAVERVTEILKGLIPPLATQRQDLTAEYIRCAIMHVIALAAGAFVAYAGHIDLFQKLTGTPSSNLTMGYAVCGLLSAGGSAFWNHILDILKAAKISSESKAGKDAQGAGKDNPIPA